MLEIDDISEFNYVPLIRVIELFKEKFSDTFSSSRLNKCIDYLEKHSNYDKKRLNKNGTIELEHTLSFAIYQLEEHFDCIKYQGEFIIKALTCENNPSYIRKSDMIFIATLLKSTKYIKEIEIMNEIIKIKDIFASNLKEIFPEDFVVERNEKNFEEEYEKTYEILKSSIFAEKNKFLQIFEANGMNLDIKIFSYIQKIIEIHTKTYKRQHENML